jgi:KUP system potassium uptake protein
MTPLALHAAVENDHELHEKVVIVYAHVGDLAHVPEDARAVFDNLGNSSDGISKLRLTFGYHDTVNIPRMLQNLREISPELDFDPYKAPYFVSLTRSVLTRRHNMPGWQKTLYGLMERNSVSSSDFYHLPVERTEEIRSLIKL